MNVCLRPKADIQHITKHGTHNAEVRGLIDYHSWYNVPVMPYQLDNKKLKIDLNTYFNPG